MWTIKYIPGTQRSRVKYAFWYSFGMPICPMVITNVSEYSISCCELYHSSQGISTNDLVFIKRKYMEVVYNVFNDNIYIYMGCSAVITRSIFFKISTSVLCQDDCNNDCWYVLLSIVIDNYTDFCVYCYLPVSFLLCLVVAVNNIFYNDVIKFTGHRWIPCTTASEAELWWFLWSAPE